MADNTEATIQPGERWEEADTGKQRRIPAGWESKSGKLPSVLHLPS